MTDYHNKYKERNPKQTIKIINNFFRKFNFNIVEEEIIQSTVCPQIWTTKIHLYYKNFKILTQRGKGLSKTFARASGYAEIYERFANKLWIYRDIRLTESFKNYNKIHNSYKYNSAEIQKDLKDLIVDINLKKCFSNTLYNDESLFANYLVNNDAILVPYKSIDNSDIQYYNPVILTQMIGSNGMAAGNTLEEALVQGISELFERETIAYLEEHLDEPYYYIDINNITDHNLINIITSLEQANNKIKIIDFSYNTGFPVVGVFFINTVNKKILLKLGSHPNFNIALERCFSEICQEMIGDVFNDINSYEQDIMVANLIKEHTWSILTALNLVCDTSNIIPEDVLFNLKSNSINYNTFIKDIHYTNTELLNCIINICSAKNLHIYYLDNSVTKAMTAVQIYCPEFRPIDDTQFNNTELTYIEAEDTIKKFNQTRKIYDINSPSINRYIDTNNHYFLSYTISDFAEQSNTLIMNALYEKETHILGNNKFDSLRKLYIYLLNSDYREVIQKYAIIFKYRILGYSFEKTNKIFNFINNESITKTDWDNSINIKCILLYILLPAFYNKYPQEWINEIYKAYL